MSWLSGVKLLKPVNPSKADAVMVGGGGIPWSNSSNRQKTETNGRVVVNAILLETATTAIDELKQLGFKDIDVTHISVSKGKQINSGTMMMARNPITIVSASKL